MQSYTEQEIIKGCLHRNPSVEEYVYKTYFNMFLSLCLRYTKNMQDAKQLLNDGFVKIFMNIHTFRGQGSFEGWMRKTMLNTCLDFVKQNYLRNSLTQPLSDHIIESKYDPTYEQALQKISFKELLNLIQLLPPITQTVFNLFVFEDYTHKEIAALLNMSEGTSYWHVHHARAVLQNKLKSIHAQNNIYERKSI